MQLLEQGVTDIACNCHGFTEALILYSEETGIITHTTHRVLYFIAVHMSNLHGLQDIFRKGISLCCERLHVSFALDKKRESFVLHLGFWIEFVLSKKYAALANHAFIVHQRS